MAAAPPSPMRSSLTSLGSMQAFYWPPRATASRSQSACQPAASQQGVGYELATRETGPQKSRCHHKIKRTPGSHGKSQKADKLKCWPVDRLTGFLSPNDLPVPDLDRYLQQGLGRGAVHDRPATRRIEDRAVAGAGEVAVAVAHDALAVRADRRVRREVAAFEVNQYRLLPGLFVGELDRRAPRHVGLLSYGPPALDLGNPVVRAPGLVRFRRPFDGALSGGGAILFGLFAPAAGRSQRG